MDNKLVRNMDETLDHYLFQVDTNEFPIYVRNYIQEILRIIPEIKYKEYFDYLLDNFRTMFEHSSSYDIIGITENYIEEIKMRHENELLEL